MNELPKVSVITFAYVSNNNGRYSLLKECIESIENQNYPNYEHIIIDDGSEVDLSHLNQEHVNVRVFKKPGTGILSSTYTFNIGHQLAKGKYCIYLPSDDIHEPNAIKNLVEVLEKQPEAALVIGEAIYEYADGSITTWSPDEKKIEGHLNEGNYINGCAVMWKRSDTLYKCLPPNYTGFCCDYDLWVTLSKLGEIAYSKSKVVKYRHVSDSTRNKTRSKFILSPRKEDKLFFQYSKESRIDFVKMRFDYDIERLMKNKKRNINNIKNVNCDIFFPYSIERDLLRRDWKKIFNEFKKNTCYSKLRNELYNHEGDIVYKNINLSTICLMRDINKPCYISFQDNDVKDSWIIDFLPAPLILDVLDDEGISDHELATFIGL